MKEDNGPLIALVVFIVLSLFFGIEAYLNKQDLDGNPEQNRPSMDKQIAEKANAVREREEEIDHQRVRSEAFLKEIRKAQAEYDWYAAQYEVYEGALKERQDLTAAAASYKAGTAKLSEDINALKNEKIKQVSSEASKIKSLMDGEVSEKNKAQAVSEAHVTEINNDKTAEEKHHKETMNFEKSRLGEQTSILKDLTEREIERATIFTEVDGKVILSDPVHGLAVIDIGSTAGVRNGYRFEVYTMKPGNKKVVKGYLEVQRADPSKSQCIIVRRPILMPKDALSDYVADQPEEMYSPFQKSGKQDASAAPLSGVSKPTVLGMNPLDPIVEGDLIQNPFFNAKKQLTFYICKAEMEEARQKNMIKYRRNEIKACAEFYGAKCVDAVDADVNYVIVQKKPEDEQYKRAKELGIPMVYEWELFRFLDNK
jgi:hypothetical protein